MSSAEKLRIAVVSTPRSGNTWVRHLIADAYRLPHFAKHAVPDDAWAALPAECVLQLHWRRDPDFLAKLEANGFRVVTLARHPLDTLISILHVAVFDVESEKWLAGAGGDETPLWGAWPRHRAFLDYCRGPRAAELLAVTPDWWGRPDVVNLRYEDFVADGAAELHKLEPAFGPLRTASVADVLARASLPEMRKGSLNNHFWKGQPGLWRQLLPAAEAYQIGWAIKPVADALGYAIDPDADLDAAAADRNWVALGGAELGATLRKATAGHVATLDHYKAAAAAGQTAADHATRERDDVLARAAADVSAASAATDAARLERDDLHTTLSEVLADLSDARQHLREAAAETAAARSEAAAVRVDLTAARVSWDVLAADLAAARNDLAAAEVRAAAESAAAEARAAVRAAEARIAADDFTQRIADAHRDLAAAFAADQRSRQVVADTCALADRLRADFHAADADRLATRNALGAARAAVHDLDGELAAARAHRDAARRDAAKLRDQAAGLARELDRFRGLQGLSVRTAWRVQRVRNRFPWAAAAFKSLSAGG